MPSCFTSVNHNKRSLVLDLTVAEGVAPARELVSRADIVVDDVRPGIMEKLGLGYDTLREIKRVLFTAPSPVSVATAARTSPVRIFSSELAAV